MFNIIDKEYKEDSVGYLVQGHAMQGVLTSDNYNKFVKYAQSNGIRTSEQLANTMWPEEEEILAEKFAAGDTSVRTKGGKYKISKLFDTKKEYSTYSSNKATVGGALDNGIPLHDKDGKPRTKDAVTKDIAAARGGGKGIAKTKINNMDRFKAYITKAKNAFNNLSEEEQTEAKEIVYNFYGDIN